jgi:hypothetical protein
MSGQVLERLQSVAVGEPVEAGGLQVFGLRWPAGGLRYATLDESVAGGFLEVSEVNEGGSVPALRVTNKGDTPVFLMAGEHLAGGKQNRVLNASILVGAGVALPIPVSCVERGRWSYRSPHFGGSGSSSHSRLRKLMHAHATEGYRSQGTPSSDQGEVWREVDRKLGETGSHSDTQYLHKAYEDTEATLGNVLASLPVPEGACGAVFAYGGRIVGFDLFDQPGTLAKLWPKLVRAYAIDAYSAGKTEQGVSTEAVRAWLSGGATGAKAEVFKSPGLGQDVRVEAPTLVGACLVVDEQPLHVEVFAQEPAGE